MAITAVFSADDVILDMDAPGKRDLLERLATEAAARLGRTEAEVLDALKDRERIGSTALGKGVALPHAELAGDIRRFMLFARLHRAIDFGAQDDEPVDLVFLVLWPAAGGKDLLSTMSEICRFLREPQILRDLRSASTPERVVEIMHQVASFAPPPPAPAAQP